MVLDASVVLKVFLNEPDTPKARALFSLNALLLAPEMARIEVASGIIRRFRVGGITRVEAQAALLDAADLFRQGGVDIKPDIEVLPRASEISLDIKRPLKDCLYIALAELEKCDFVTADSTLIARAGGAFPFMRAL
jgi:predicted nucleic acid-binding protein